MIFSVNEQIFKRLEAACAETGVSLAELSRDTGIALSSIYRWKAGSLPRRKNIDALASRLDINANWLFTGEGEMRNAVVSEATTSCNVRMIGPTSDIFVATVPVISWAHAGMATSYEELPDHWQEHIPTTCKGRRAFGLIVEGDSMTPRCEPGDIVTVDPDLELRNGGLVVVKLKNDGVMLRRFSRMDTVRVKLIAYNALYPSTEHTLQEFHWIYPVHSTFRRELI